MSPSSRFRDRREAGRRLAEALEPRLEGPRTLVLALPRGGVPVGWEVARALGLELDLMLVRKLGVPGHEEYAMGAIASGGVRVLDGQMVEGLGISSRQVEQVAATEEAEMQRRSRLYRGKRPEPEVAGREVVVVDDGLATGSTMVAALQALATRQPKRLVAGSPVGSPQACRRVGEQAAVSVCLWQPDPFGAVSLYYQDFSQVSDQEVQDLLARDPSPAGQTGQAPRAS
jgi:predicted phosphoribosyltransferase